MTRAIQLTDAQQLSQAILIATIAHDQQFDKAGKPYILHPLHVMNQLLFDTQLATIGVLHDVVEDSGITLLNLRQRGFSDRVTSALSLLTHNPDVSYSQYIQEISTNYDALRVKRKDLQHNSDITRLKGITQKDFARMQKYHEAFLILGKAKSLHRED